VVQPYYVYPNDQAYHPEYERAVSPFILEVQQWYAARVGMPFHLAPVEVVRASEDYLSMRCGPQPSEAGGAANRVGRACAPRRTIR
jgi:hypothetical protein